MELFCFSCSSVVLNWFYLWVCPTRNWNYHAKVMKMFLKSTLKNPYAHYMIHSILLFWFTNVFPPTVRDPIAQLRTTDVDQSECMFRRWRVWMLRHSQHCEISVPFSRMIRDLDEAITLDSGVYALYRLINMFDFIILFYFAKVIVLNIFIHQNGVIRQL